jgi:hypothetical protein
MLFKKTIIICSENHAKPMNKIYEKNAELLNAKWGGTYQYHLALEG